MIFCFVSDSFILLYALIIKIYWNSTSIRIRLSIYSHINKKKNFYFINWREKKFQLILNRLNRRFISLTYTYTLHKYTMINITLVQIKVNRNKQFPIYWLILKIIFNCLTIDLLFGGTISKIAVPSCWPFPTAPIVAQTFGFGAPAA